MYLSYNSLLMLPSLILFLKIAMQMMCNHVLYQIDAADFALPQQIWHCRRGFCISAADFHFRKQHSHYLSRFSSVAVGDPSRPPNIYIHQYSFTSLSVCFVFTASIKLYSSHNQGKLYKIH